MLLEVTVPLSCWENFRIQEASRLKNVLPALVLIGTTTDHAYFSSVEISISHVELQLIMYRVQLLLRVKYLLRDFVVNITLL